MNTKAAAGDTAGTPPAAPAEPRNVKVSAYKNRTPIGGVLVAAGHVDFPLTKTEAETLRDLGLVEIVGIFTT